jgi:hypothetical protein
VSGGGPASLLWVPRLFVPAVIRKVVAPGKPGAYALGNDRGGFVPGYVGRSDACLRSRLLSHNHLYRFEYFVFRYEPSATAAFQTECELFHVYGQLGVRLHNLVHPAQPVGAADGCPYCGFANRWSKITTASGCNVGGRALPRVA